MCNTDKVAFLSVSGMINRVPLYKIPSSYVISSLKYQYDWMLHGQSCIVLGQPSYTICASNCRVESFLVASLNSCSLPGLAGAVCVV